MGEGDQGQKCARGEGCLDSVGGGLCWVEIDCSESRPHIPQSAGKKQDRSGNGEPDASGGIQLSEDEDGRAGYLRQEIEGIGGVVKKKVKKKIRVGAPVWEFVDERETGDYLGREASGQRRSWCGWCERVVLGEHDTRQLEML